MDTKVELPIISHITIYYPPFGFPPQPFKNIKIILHFRGIQKQVAGQIWPMTHSLQTLGALSST